MGGRGGTRGRTDVDGREKLIVGWAGGGVKSIWCCEEGCRASYESAARGFVSLGALSLWNLYRTHLGWRIACYFQLDFEVWDGWSHGWTLRRWRSETGSRMSR